MTTTAGGDDAALAFALADGQLMVTLPRNFDAGNVHQDWAQQVQVLHPGPFSRIVIDCSRCAALSSTFFAGLMQLHHHYRAQGTPPIRLLRPDPRVVRNITILRLHVYFDIVPR